MAKDEGKKDKSKADKPAKYDDGFANPSEAPNAGGGDGWKFESDDNVGSLFLVMPLREESTPDAYHEGQSKTVIVCDIVKLNENKPKKSKLHADSWVFGGWTKGSLRGYIGERRVLGRLAQGPKDRGNKPWILEDADSDDIDVAKAYLASVDPFEK